MHSSRPQNAFGGFEGLSTAGQAFEKQAKEIEIQSGVCNSECCGQTVSASDAIRRSGDRLTLADILNQPSLPSEYYRENLDKEPRLGRTSVVTAAQKGSPLVCGMQLTLTAKRLLARHLREWEYRD